MQDYIIFLNNNYKIQARECILLRESSDNCVYKVIGTDNNKYVLRESKRDLGSDVIFELSWLDKLNQLNLPVARVLRTNNGKMYTTKNGKVVVLFSYIEGQHIKIQKDTKPSMQHTKNAAKALALIHNVSSKINLDIQRDRTVTTELSRVLLSSDEFAKYYDDGKMFVDLAEKYYKFAHNSKQAQSLILNDYRPGNVLFLKDKVAGVLDFDWSCMGPRIKDVAHSLMEWSFPDGAGKPWFDVVEAFLQAYNSSSDIKFELDSELFEWIKFSALSDTATYLCDLMQTGEKRTIKGSYMYQKFLYFSQD
ncbi:MAG: phosphotransferase [Patescibacteria group bacterium]|nr:phosphotransferase [Patescibacteria group bacterium]